MTAETPGCDPAAAAGRRIGRTRAFYCSVAFIPARELPNLWPDQPALLARDASGGRP